MKGELTKYKLFLEENFPSAKLSGKLSSNYYICTCFLSLQITIYIRMYRRIVVPQSKAFPIVVTSVVTTSLSHPLIIVFLCRTMDYCLFMFLNITLFALY